MLHSDKTELRRLLIAKRTSLSSDERQKAEKNIVERIVKTVQWQSAQKIASYAPFKSEVNLSDLHESAWQEKKTLYLPVLQHDQLVFAPYLPNSAMRLNQYQISEVDTDSDTLVTGCVLDLLLIPVVGFDNRAYRLGMGKGYYDKTLSTLLNEPLPKFAKRPFFMGVAFACQEVIKLPIDPWDIPLDMIVTEKS
ncbi:MAG: 5-formyltetrahydrofolate cyclo-ligase [Legionellales bacterium]|nr:5-formyltetrahydrofolate cyclo-ligase [Legionellales bacterium]